MHCKRPCANIMLKRRLKEALQCHNFTKNLFKQIKNNKQNIFTK